MTFLATDSLSHNSPKVESDRLLIGVPDMAAETGISERRLRHWIANGFLTTVTKRGNLWTVPRSKLRADLGLID
jgi:phage antirepressor YoqD-like protein